LAAVETQWITILPVDIDVTLCISIDLRTWCEQPPRGCDRLAAIYNLSVLDTLTCVIVDEWHYDTGLPVLILHIPRVSWIGEI